MAESTLAEALAMADAALAEGLAVAGNVRPSSQELAEFEERFGVQFPADYAEFLGRYGTYETSAISILGFTEKRHLLPSLEFATDMIRRVWPGLSTDIIPVQSLGGGKFYCLRTAGARTCVTRWPPFNDEQPEDIIAPSFATFLAGRVAESYWQMKSFARAKDYGDWFDENYAKKGKIPRADIWRPLRFCSQDVVLGLCVISHSVEYNCLLVDVCMVYDPFEFERHSGAKMMAISLLSEAYKAGGSLEVRFTENVEGGRVPRSLVDLATSANVHLRHIDEGRLTSDEARKLYLAISDLSAPLQASILKLSLAGRLAIERACYAIHHGVWARHELESLVLGTSSPDSLLAGTLAPEDRHNYLQGLHISRAAIMGGWLDRRMFKREQGIGSGEVLDIEDDARHITVSFHSELFAKVYEVNEDAVDVPWLVNREAGAGQLKSGDRLVVVIRARTAAEIVAYFEDDLEAALNAVDETATKETQLALLYPRDFDDLLPKERQAFLDLATSKHVGVLSCPESTFSLDEDARRRFHTSRIMRQ